MRIIKCHIENFGKLSKQEFNFVDGLNKITEDNLIDITRSIEVLDSVPFQLQKTNKKFQYGVMGNGKRSKEYEDS